MSESTSVNEFVNTRETNERYLAYEEIMDRRIRFEQKWWEELHTLIAEVVLHVEASGKPDIAATWVAAEVDKALGEAFPPAPRRPPSAVELERRKLNSQMRREVHERCAYRCRLCGSHKRLVIDHVVAIIDGGKTTLDNLQTLCHDCNSAKEVERKSRRAKP